MRAYVPYCDDPNDLVIVDLPTWPERHLWWPLAWKTVGRWEWLRHRVFRLGSPYRRGPRWIRTAMFPWNRAANWLTTHTPWWGGPGIGRPYLHEHIVGEPFK